MNIHRIKLNYACIDNEHLSDAECAELVVKMKTQGEAQRVKKQADISKKWPINTRCGTWRQPLIKKIVAQWNDLANQGKVKNRRLEACRSYCEKQTGVTRLEWFSRQNFNTVIEGLKAWQIRQTTRSH